MSTIKQKNLAKLTLQHPTLPKGELVEMGGYGVATQNNPSKALESKGYLQELDKLGLTDELIVNSLVEDIRAKPKNRISELRLASEIRGLNKNEEQQTTRPIIINMPLQVNQRFEIDGTDTEAIRSDTQQEQI